MSADTVTFAGAKVSNESGIDITQKMIDNVANPFLDLNAIVTQFKFVVSDNNTTIDIKIPSGTTVKYGEEQCTLLEDVTATLTPSSLTGDSHATTTSGTVLSGTSLEAGQLITTSGQWVVKLKDAVKVRTQDGYVILGSKDPNELGGGEEVSLSEGTNVYATAVINVTKVNEKTSQFYFLADVSYHQIVLQELYDTLTALQESGYKSNLLGYLSAKYIGAGRDKLTREEYNAMKNMSLTEIKDYLSGLNWLSENDLSDKNTLDSLVSSFKNNTNISASEIISIYEKYGVFSDDEIKNLKENKSLDGAKDQEWTVNKLIDLAYDKTFSDTEIDNIRKSAAEKFFDSLKNEPNIAVDDIKRAINGMCSVDGDDINSVCDNLKNKVGNDDFTIDEFDAFLKNLLNINVPSSEICPLPECESTSVTATGTTFFKSLNNFFGSFSDAEIVTRCLRRCFDVESIGDLQDQAYDGDLTLKEIYETIRDKGPSGSYDNNWADIFKAAVADPGNAGYLNIDDNYFNVLKGYTEGTNPLLTLDDLKKVCNNLNVNVGKSVDDCIKNLRKSVVAAAEGEEQKTVSQINSELSEIAVSRWKQLKTQISTDDKVVDFIISNKSISLEQLKEAVKNTNIYTESSIQTLRDSIEGANSKTEIMELLSHNELKNTITIGDLVTGLTKLHKYSADVYDIALINEISSTGKLDGNVLYDYRTTSSDFDSDYNVTKLASEKILEKLSNETRIDYDGFKSGLLSISRFNDGEVDNAIANCTGYASVSQEYVDNMNKLLNLCLLAGTPASGESSYVLATGVQRTLDSNGNYVYEIVSGSKTITSSSLDASFSKQDATAGMALPYFALAIMYEKTCIQQMILVEQLKQIEKINDEIEENNKALKSLTELYDKVYTAVTWSAKASEVNQYENLSTSVSLDGCEMSVSELDKYLRNTVQNGSGLGNKGTVSDFASVNAESYRVNGDEFITVVARYDRDGNNMWDKYTKTDKDGSSNLTDFDSNTSNIDVKEQATLTHISNLQDQVRMYGDTLSTDAQLMTTKMEQYMQDANSCVSACTQTVKSIGDYYKNIITNIR